MRNIGSRDAFWKIDEITLAVKFRSWLTDVFMHPIVQKQYLYGRTGLKSYFNHHMDICIVFGVIFFSGDGGRRLKGGHGEHASSTGKWVVKCAVVCKVFLCYHGCHFTLNTQKKLRMCKNHQHRRFVSSSAKIQSSALMTLGSSIGQHVVFYSFFCSNNNIS